MKSKMTAVLLALTVSGALSGLLASCQEGDFGKGAHFAPTNLEPIIPSSDFTAYVNEARQHAVAANQAAGRDIPLEEVAAAGPFEMRPRSKDSHCRSRSLDQRIKPDDPSFRYDRGILLIHGLNDTPFSLWDLGHRFAKECYLVRSVLLPGHGTVPGDLQENGLPEWREAVKQAVLSFDGKVDRLVVAGMGLGANLALDAAYRVSIPSGFALPPAIELNGVVLLAPAFEYQPPVFAPASVAPGGQALWGNMLEEDDALRYQSIAKPSVEATNRLGRNLFEIDAPRHLPIFVVASAEDGVAEPRATRDWFCRQHVTPRHLLWYSRYPDAPFPSCSCIVARRDRSEEERSSCVTIRASSCVPPSTAGGRLEPVSSSAQCQANPYKTASGDGAGAILDLAHNALLAAPENPRYGAATKRRDCLHYEASPDEEKREACAGQVEGDINSDIRYGEVDDDNLGNYVLRRLTYNPDFDHMAARIIDFLERSR